MSMLKDWRTWLATGLVAFWIWRVFVSPVEIGLVLFATSAGLPVAAFLFASAARRARRDGRSSEPGGRRGSSPGTTARPLEA